MRQTKGQSNASGEGLLPDSRFKPNARLFVTLKPFAAVLAGNVFGQFILSWPQLATKSAGGPGSLPAYDGRCRDFEVFPSPRWP